MAPGQAAPGGGLGGDLGGDALDDLQEERVAAQQEPGQAPGKRAREKAKNHKNVKIAPKKRAKMAPNLHQSEGIMWKILVSKKVGKLQKCEKKIMQNAKII